ncbi:hypothetical protein L13192_04872 [Pyrenophora tritici-repentis]|uniref:Uncharacterized protein n=1 Tax=Pyrenophora tritici-repentis TaxID=45151 RepID=A0A922NLM2_9PLEO|nr:hypothetical protein Ptr86124_004778 [Pyrenophora tritici-repentis]KAI1671515.1 hypothetical protein L13192_04872 [Pyrenophora tritici-repentis]KAI1685352.1 hypothetical protein KJE20_05636 [Pyrenophora tritici-repentis]
MDPNAASNLPERLLRQRELPSLRGEDETELRYLVDLIESTSWILSPISPPTCILGRHPPPKNPPLSTSTLSNPSATNAFCASLYTIGKAGARTLELGPEVGKTRKETLGRLLECVEVEVGRLMLNDEWRGRKGSGKGEGK